MRLSVKLFVRLMTLLQLCKVKKLLVKLYVKLLGDAARKAVC